MQAVVAPHDPAAILVILPAVEDASFTQCFEVLENLLP